MIEHSSEQEIIVEKPGLGLFTDTEIDHRLLDNRAWTNGRNIRFYANASKVKKTGSYDPFDTTPGNVHIRQLMKYVDDAGIDSLVRVGNAEVWEGDNTPTSIGSGLTADADDIVTWDQYEHYLVWTDYKDRVKRWTAGDPAFVNLGGLSSDFRAKIVRVFKSHLLFFNTVDTGTITPWRMVYSATGTPEIYTGATSGVLDMVTTPGPIMAAEVQEDYVLVFKERAIYRVSFIGLPLNFSSEVVSSEDGTISARSAIKIGPFVYYLGGFNFYRIATSPEPIGDPIFETYRSEVDQTRRHLIFAYHMPSEREVVWRCPRPEDTQPTIEFAFNYDENTWSVRDSNPGTSFLRLRAEVSATGDDWDTGFDEPDDTWDGGAAIAWDDPSLAFGEELELYSTTTGVINSYRLSGAQDTSFTSYVESKIFHLGALNAARIIRIPLVCKGTGALRVMARAWDDERESMPPFSEVAQFSLSSNRRPYVDVRLWGRLAQLRFENLAGTDEFQLEMYGLKYVPGLGER